MEIFYHFSHFLEILTGIYFGGFALLGFIENEAVSTAYTKLQKRQEEAKRGRVAASDFYKTFTLIPSETPVKFLVGSISFFIFLILEWLGRVMFLLAHVQIEKIANSESPKILQKKFFPSFFQSVVIHPYGE